MSTTWQAVQAIVLAIITSGGVVVAARFQANRKSPRRESLEDEQHFRGELRDDNAALRAEIRLLKAELIEKDRIADELRAKYYDILYPRQTPPPAK